MSSEETSQETSPKIKTAKLIVPPHYHLLGYHNYTTNVDLSLDTPLTLKSAGSRNGDVQGMTLLFRGRKISPEEENMTFSQLISRYNVSPEEEVLVFHCTVHPDVIANHQQNQKRARNTVQDPPQMPQDIPNGGDNNTSATSAPQTRTPMHNQDLPPAVMTDDISFPPPSAPPQQLSIPPPRGNIPGISRPSSSDQPTRISIGTQTAARPQVQVLPIQYQAVLINGLPFLVQLANSQPTLRLPSNTAIPVRTHTGQTAYIINPDGVATLARQGCRIHSFQFLHPPPLPGAQVVGQIQVIGQQIVGQQPERRLVGLTDLIALFRRRGIMQHVWLVCKLAFMVGLFSSHNASWRRIFGLCLVAVGIYLWQIGELERWFSRFRRPVALPQPPPPAVEEPRREGDRQDGPMSFLWTFFRIAEQVLFVFVASLWPNAVVMDGLPPPPPVAPEIAPPANAAGNGEREVENQEEHERELFQDNEEQPRPQPQPQAPLPAADVPAVVE